MEVFMEDVKWCQSCCMPMKEAKDFGTEKGGNASEDYCVHCYAEGEFTWHAASLDEAVEGNVSFWNKEEGETDEQLFTRVKNEFLKLKRWQTA